MITANMIKRKKGEFCCKKMKGIPITSKIPAATNHKVPTAQLYRPVSSTSGGFTNAKKPTVSFDLQQLIPIPKNRTETILHRTKAIILRPLLPTGIPRFQLKPFRRNREKMICIYFETNFLIKSLRLICLH